MKETYNNGEDQVGVKKIPSSNWKTPNSHVPIYDHQKLDYQRVEHPLQFTLATQVHKLKFSMAIKPFPIIKIDAFQELINVFFEQGYSSVLKILNETHMSVIK